MASVEEQYSTAAYSTHFVQDPKNVSFYKEYIYHTFFEQIEPRFLATATRALDIGCGDGELSRQLYRRNNSLQITSIDLSQAMLEAAEQLDFSQGIPSTSIRYLHGNIFDVSVAESEFDLVVSGFVACHMTTREMLDEFFKKSFKALKPGGITLHLLTPSGDSSRGDGHVERVALHPNVVLYDVCWTDNTYQQSAKSAGFENIKIEYAKVSAKGERDMCADWKSQMEGIGYKVIRCSKP